MVIVTLFLKIQRIEPENRTQNGRNCPDGIIHGHDFGFPGMIFADVTTGPKGWIPVFVMIVSSLLMLVCGFFVKVLKVKWMEDYALPISMLGAMALSIPITRLLG